MVPIAAYLLMRLPAITATLQGGGGPYSPSVAFLLPNVIAYAAQPFLLGATDLQGARSLPQGYWVLALVLQAMVVVLLTRRHGLSTALAYVAAYLLFLFPVLALPFVAAHYLYAAGPVLAFALASLWPARPMDGWWRGIAAVGAAGVVALLAARSVEIQLDMLRQGRCQATVLTTVDAVLGSSVASDVPQFRIVADVGAPEYVAHRAFFGRWPYSGDTGPRVVVGTAEPEVPDERVLRMRQDCLVVVP